MTRKIVLRRGVNVGGNRMLPMKSFGSLLNGLGCANVATYIQSGNAIFEGTAKADAIADAIEKEHGFRPDIFVLTLSALNKSLAACPYQSEGIENGKTVHTVFLDKAPGNNVKDAFDQAKIGGERYAIAGKTLYLHTPDGLSNSGVAAKMGRVLKSAHTARNWNTVKALIDLAENRDEKK